jgi:hypothetical protein
VAISTLVIGSIAAFGLLLGGLALVGEYGGAGGSLIFFGSAFGVFLTAAASACVLSLLASIDEKLEVGHAAQEAVSASKTTRPSGSFRRASAPYPASDDADPEADPDADSKAEFERSRGQ